MGDQSINMTRKHIQSSQNCITE